VYIHADDHVVRIERLAQLHQLVLRHMVVFRALGRFLEMLDPDCRRMRGVRYVDDDVLQCRALFQGAVLLYEGVEACSVAANVVGG